MSVNIALAYLIFIADITGGKVDDDQLSSKSGASQQDAINTSLESSSSAVMEETIEEPTMHAMVGRTDGESREFDNTID